jgi:hypothetical protein
VSVWLDDHEHILPATPKPAQSDPEQSVDGFYRGPRALPFKDGELLSQGEDFQRRIGATEEENADGGKEGRDARNHE